jgi:hypothetical protein
MIGRMDYLAECKLHEKRFTILQIGDKWSQRVQMSPRLSHANSRIGSMQNETFFRILHLSELTLKRSGNGKHVDYLA